MSRRFTRIDHRADDALRVDHERGARVDAAFLVEDAVELAGCVLGPVAQQRELEVELLRESVRGGEAVNAYAQNLGAGREDRILDLRKT